MSTVRMDVMEVLGEVRAAMERLGAAVEHGNFVLAGVALETLRLWCVVLRKHVNRKLK